MGELGVDVNEEQEADELADEGGGDGNQHLGVAGENIQATKGTTWGQARTPTDKTPRSGRMKPGEVALGSV